MKNLNFKSLLSILFCSISLLFVSSRKISTAEKNPKIDKLKLQAGFKAEHLYSPSENEKGSWVSMAFDDKGRMIASDQYGGLFRITLPVIGTDLSKINIEPILIAGDTAKLGAAQGLLYAFNSLYVVVNNSPSKNLPKTSGLYRLQDTNNDDQYDKLTLFKELKGNGEHGPHSIILSPDKKSLYLIAGNHTDVPEFDSYIYPKNWQEDNIFPLIKDPRGHANDRKAPGGWVANVDPDGKNWKLVSAGYRNAFDIAFNDIGDLFVYDADMEWDFGTPWYRPTRICHATLGSEYGWRTGNSKWSPTFPDNLPPVINIGQGSPTSLIYAKSARFPNKYKQTLLAFDWSFGIIHAIHLKPSGSTYTAEREEFLSGIPLPLTDGTIGPDGALYFLTGGRRLQSDLYRVYYEGPESVETTASTTITKENSTRKELESLLYVSDAKNIEKVWPYLNSSDRFIRFTARAILEKQPVNDWLNKALAEKQPNAVLNTLVALARTGNESHKNTLIEKLNTLDFKTLSTDQKLDFLRVAELSILRLGTMNEVYKKALIGNINASFPSTNYELNKALSKILIPLEAPNAVASAVKLLYKLTNQAQSDAVATSSADLILRNPQYGLDIAKMMEKTPPQEQTYIAVVLSQAKLGWTPELREQYFKWFKKAFEYKGGNSYVGFIDKARKMALSNVPKDKYAYYDKLSGADLVSENGNNLIIKDYPKGPGRSWKVEDALAALDDNKTEPNLENGKAMYNAITCSRCHAFDGEGSNIGPDLSQAGNKFSTKDLLEAIILPNKSISDQYAATQFRLKNGETIVGRIVSEDNLNYTVSQNPYAPNYTMKVTKKQVVDKRYSESSVMLPGLIDSLNPSELNDLISYISKRGK